jgi:hypothetical protein
MDNNLIFILVIGIVILWFINKREEMTNTTKYVKNLAICKDCRAWNHLDIRSKCNKTCKIRFPDKNTTFTGESVKLDKDLSCECSFIGAYQKEYIGCPIGTKLDDTSCFIWNDKEAGNLCPAMCKKFLPDYNPKWTGNWKTTSAESSACECEYYN